MAAFSIMHAAGVVKLLRFIWWRVNGWAEVVAEVVAIFTTVFFLSPWGGELVVTILQATGNEGNDAFYIYRMLLLMAGSSLMSVMAILLTPSEAMEHLCEFYRRLRPFGFFGGALRQACGEGVKKPDSLSLLVLLTISGLAMVYGLLFAALGLFWPIGESLGWPWWLLVWVPWACSGDCGSSIPRPATIWPIGFAVPFAQDIC